MGNDQSSMRRPQMPPIGSRAQTPPIERSTNSIATPPPPPDSLAASAGSNKIVFQTRLRAMTQPTISTTQDSAFVGLSPQQSLTSPLLDPSLGCLPAPAGTPQTRSRNTPLPAVHAPSPPIGAQVTPSRRKPQNFTSIATSPASFHRASTATTTTAGVTMDSLEGNGFLLLSPQQQRSLPSAPPAVQHSPLTFSVSRSPSIVMEGKELSRMGMEVLQLPPMISTGPHASGPLTNSLPYFTRPDWHGHESTPAPTVGSSAQDIGNPAMLRFSLSGVDTSAGSEPSSRRPHSVTFCDAAVVMQSDDEDDEECGSSGLIGGDSTHPPCSTCVPLQPLHLSHTLQIAKSNKGPQRPNTTTERRQQHRQL